MKFSNRIFAQLLILVALSQFGLGLDPGLTFLITSRDGASVNGSPASGASLLHPGDRIRTDASGSSEILFGRTHLSLGHRTSIQILADRIQLQNGFAQISGIANLLVGGYRVNATSESADYEVVKLLDGQCYLHVSSGSLQLTSSAGSFAVSADSAVSFRSQDQSKDQQTPSKDQQTPSKDQQTPPSSSTVTVEEGQTTTTTTTSTEVIPPLEGTGARPAATVPLTVAVGIILGAAVAAGLIAYLLTTGKPPASGDRPRATTQTF